MDTKTANEKIRIVISESLRQLHKQGRFLEIPSDPDERAKLGRKNGCN